MNHVQSLFDLTGKKALITGGGTGIGLTIAEGLAGAGASIAICGRGKHGNLENAAKQLRKISSEVFTSICDVSIESDIIKLVQDLDDRNFPIDILVNNAGVSWGHESENMSLEKWNLVIEINLKGSFFMTKEIVNKFMIPRGKGSIINITSVAAYKGGSVGISGYSASKAGILGITKQLAIEWASYGIRVNAIAPSWFPSYMSRHFTSEDSPIRQQLIDQNPMRRLGEPWELQGVVVFLASKASSYITGTIIPIDGGLLAK